MLKSASWMPLARSGRSPAAADTAGSIVRRAVAPAGSKNAPRAASAINQVSVRLPSAPTTGMAATLRALSASETTAVRRRPTRSTTVPANSAVISSGSAPAAATSAASDALPVSSRTSQGSAIIAMPLPGRGEQRGDLEGDERTPAAAGRTRGHRAPSAGRHGDPVEHGVDDQVDGVAARDAAVGDAVGGREDRGDEEVDDPGRRQVEAQRAGGLGAAHEVLDGPAQVVPALDHLGQVPDAGADVEEAQLVGEGEDGLGQAGEGGLDRLVAPGRALLTASSTRMRASSARA